MKRRIAVLVLAAAFALSVVGCEETGTAKEDGAERLEESMEENVEDSMEESVEDSVEEGAEENTEKDMAETAGKGEAEEDGKDFLAQIKTAKNGAGVSVHDPSIKVFDGKYYLYGSHMTGAWSEDMQSWTYIGNTYTSSNPLFENLFVEGLGVFDYAGTYEDGSHSVWAEDVIYNRAMEKYVMYLLKNQR